MSDGSDQAAQQQRTRWLVGRAVSLRGTGMGCFTSRLKGNGAIIDLAYMCFPL